MQMMLKIAIQKDELRKEEYEAAFFGYGSYKLKMRNHNLGVADLKLINPSFEF
jgi:hypothetical protein